MSDGGGEDPRQRSSLSPAAAPWAEAYAAGTDGWSRIDPTRRSSATIAAELAPHSRILDVGCGRGVDVARYAADGHTATGIDPVALPDWAGVTAQWPLARFEQVALVDHEPVDPYDVVVDAGCFHHQRPEHLDAHLAATRRVLRAAGTLWLATLRPRGRENPYAPAIASPQPDGSYTLAFDENMIGTLLADAGFTVLTTTVVPRERASGLDDLLVHAHSG